MFLYHKLSHVVIWSLYILESCSVFYHISVIFDYRLNVGKLSIVNLFAFAIAYFYMRIIYGYHYVNIFCHGNLPLLTRIVMCLMYWINFAWIWNIFNLLVKT